MELFSLTGKIAVEYSDAVKGLKQVSGAADDTAGTLGDADEAAKKTGDSIGDAGESAKGASDGFTIWKGVISGLVSNAITGLISKCTELAGKMVDLTKTAVGNYAEYEQLVGGVETLFKDSSGTLIEYAESAYKTAGLSANDYMDTATSFAASLIQGLGGDTAQAVELTNLAITDMSDNANKMGTDITSIQTAYQGFAKQNYTMLDNLKLGYGGTQEEMIRLINDSGILNEEISSLDGITFDQMIEAIHAIQTNLGITGTTAAEAGSTISGSWSSVQAMFQNILTKVGGELAPTVMGFLSQLSEWLESVDWDAFAESIGNAFSGILDWIQQIDFTAFFEGAKEGVTSLIEFFGKALEYLPSVIDFFKQWGPTIMAVVGCLVALKAAFAIKDIISRVTGAITTLNAAMNANPILAIISLIAMIVSALITLWTTNEDFRNAVIAIWEGIKQVFQTVIDGIIAFFQNFYAIASSVVEAVIGFFQTFWETVSGFFTTLWNTIVSIFTGAAMWFYNTVILPVVTFFQGLWEAVSGFFQQLWNDITGIFVGASTWFYNTVISPVVNFFQGLWTAVSGFFQQLWNDIVGIFTGASTWFYNTVISPVVNFFSGLWDGVVNGAGAAWEGIKNAFATVANFFGTIFGNAWQAVKDVFSKGGAIFSGIVEGIISFFVGIVNTIIDGINAVVAIPFNAINGALDALRGVNILGLEPFWWIPSIGVPQIPNIPQAAEGGVLERGQMAFLEGEGGEAIVPLEKNTQWIDRVAERLNGSAGNYNQVSVKYQTQQVSLLESINSKLDSAISMNTKIDSIISIFGKLFPVLEKGHVLVLDDGALVAEIAPAMDEELGRMAIRKGR